MRKEFKFMNEWMLFVFEGVACFFNNPLMLFSIITRSIQLSVSWNLSFRCL